MPELSSVGTVALASATAAGALATLAAGAARTAAPDSPTRRSRQRTARALLATSAAALLVAAGALAWGLVTSDGTLVYVADNSRRGAHGLYRLAGLWGGLEGSMLLLTTLLAVVVAGAELVRRPTAAAPSDDHGAARDRAACLALAGGGLLVTALAAITWRVTDPFATLQIPAIDGGGLTPILEHPAMLVHPPLLYLGTVLTCVPFLRTAATLLERAPLDAAWRRTTRSWLLVSWTILTAALALGANWAYVELGWGGYWAWDPIENTALLPWLTITAFLHTTRRGAWLVLTTFTLVVLGALLTRSGAADSVHAFGQAAAVGRALGGVLAAIVVVDVVALVRGRGAPTLGGDVPPLPEPALRRVQLALLMAAVVVVLAGTLTPPVADALGATERTIGGEFYARLLAPIAVAITGLAVSVSVRLLLDRRATKAPRRRTWTGHLAHLGLAVLTIGVAGTATTTETTAGLDPGDRLDVGPYTLELVDSTVTERDTGPGLTATVAVLRGDREVAVLRPELNAYPGRGIVLAETALRSTPLDDLQVGVRNASDDGTVLVEAAVRPFAMWVWWGAVLLVAAGVLTLLRRQPVLSAPSPPSDP